MELFGSELAFQYRMYRFLCVFKLDDLVIIKAQWFLSCAIEAQRHKLLGKIFIQFKLHHFLFFQKAKINHMVDGSVLCGCRTVIQFVENLLFGQCALITQSRYDFRVP